MRSRRHVTWPPVALKIAHRKYASTAFQEIHAHRTLESAGVAGCAHLTRMIEAFPHEGHVCIAFQLHGRDLSHAIPQGGMSLAETKQVTRQTLEALAAMHDAGFIHTDVKPGNILYDPELRIARLADLGLATTQLTDGEEVATCDYTPPEGLVGAPMTAAIDLWSLGCTIFKLLTGKLLFDPWQSCHEKYDEFQDEPETDSPSGAESESSHGDDALKDDPQRHASGQVVAGKYLLKRRLGEGKFGTVWESIPLHDEPVPTPPAGAFLQQARAKRAETEVTPRKRWDLTEVAVAYEHLLQMHQLLGPIPSPLTQGKWRSLFYSEEGRLRFDAHVEHLPLAQRLAESLPPKEAEAAAGFLGDLLAYDPNARPTPRHALESEWLAPERVVA